MLDYFADGQIKNVIKSKGVQKKFMTREIFTKMMETNEKHFIKLEDGSTIIVDRQEFLRTCAELEIDPPELIAVPRMTDVVAEKWQRFNSGVTKAPIMKIIAPSHKKRLHNLQDSTSTPFVCVAD